MPSIPIPLAAAIAVTVTVGCFTGPSVSGFPPALSAHGVEAELRVAGGPVRGELLEVRDTAFVLTNTGGLLLVPFTVVSRASFSDIGSYSGGAPGGEMRERLRLVSRYPHGMPTATLAALLADRRQSELRVVR